MTDEKDLKKAKRLKDHLIDPTKVNLDIASALEDLNKDVQKISIEGAELVTIKGQKGDKGDTPEKGKDYFTTREINEFISAATPIKGKDYFTSSEIREFKKQVTPVKGEDYFDGKDGEDGKDSVVPGPKGDPGEKGDPGLDGKDGSSDTPEEIREKLLSLEKPIPMSAIDGLDKEFEKANQRVFSGSSHSGGRVVMYKDLSDSLDGGVTRTFNMPAFYRILSIHLSSFPNILRPTVDYTWDTSACTLTITSEIPDASLTAGQTLLVLYSEI